MSATTSPAGVGKAGAAPDNSAILNNLGVALIKAGRFEEAIAIEPHHAPALVNLADALAATGQLDASE